MHDVLLLDFAYIFLYCLLLLQGICLFLFSPCATSLFAQIIFTASGFLHLVCEIISIFYRRFSFIFNFFFLVSVYCSEAAACWNKLCWLRLCTRTHRLFLFRIPLKTVAVFKTQHLSFTINTIQKKNLAQTYNSHIQISIDTAVFACCVCCYVHLYTVCLYVALDLYASSPYRV